MITNELIEAEFQSAIKACEEHIPLNKWRDQPTFITTYSHKSKYGEVFASDNGVRITDTYLGTDFIEALRDTIRHELAHLCVGIRTKKGSPAHGRVWQRVYHAFTSDIDDELANNQKETIADSIVQYKWSVYAHLKGGSRELVGQVHKKTAKWSKYPRSEHERHTMNGTLVLKYEFIEN